MRKCFWILVSVVVVFTMSNAVAQSQRAPKSDIIIKPEQEEFMKQAQDAMRLGKTDEALKLATRAVNADQTNFVAYAFRARLNDHIKRYDAAAVDYTVAIQIAPAKLELLQARAMSQFRAGRLHDAIKDWEIYLRQEQDVARDPYLFTLGIAYAITGRYDDGRKRFAWYNTVSGDDVEAAAWHFLCVAKKSGGDGAASLARAQEALLTVSKDKRLPMMQIYELYKGTLRPANVLAAARAGEPAAEELQRRLFYADLYLGIYYDAAHQPGMARQYLRRVAAMGPVFERDPTLGFMTDVARVYADTLDAADARDTAATIAASPEARDLRRTQGIVWVVASLLVLYVGVRVWRSRRAVRGNLQPPAGGGTCCGTESAAADGHESTPRPAVAAAMAAEKVST
ncbi:MAG: hypothetical protein EXS22_04365 [Pedosphaera sp.]|nr:hypothetical protein [Pedosphaera sp.]MSU43262.1 hypothetical protein [Pedosphaera sp.]